jgi:septum site-determining protein MinC
VSLDTRLSARRAFFQGATVTANLGAREMDEAEFAALRNLFDALDMTLDVVVSTAPATRAIAGAAGVRNRAPAFGGKPDLSPQPPPPLGEGESQETLPDSPAPTPDSALRTPHSTLEGEPDFVALAGEDTAPVAEADWAADGAAGALFVRRTLRSGMRIWHDGDVCILGDVNAGAEIVAGGDVVVWGVLRGMVHAGAGGDTAAVVCALLLAPTQLRIADRVSRGSAPSGPAAPEQARVVDEGIAVEPWTPRRK